MFTSDTELVAGGKVPYDAWTFVVVPDEVVAAWAIAPPLPVRGTLAGTPFLGTLSRGEGVLRMPVPRALAEEAGVCRGDRVELTIEPDPEPRPVQLPDELRALLDADPELARLFMAMAPSHQRAWATHIGEAKRPETRARRASRAADGIRRRVFPGE